MTRRVSVQGTVAGKLLENKLVTLKLGGAEESMVSGCAEAGRKDQSTDEDLVRTAGFWRGGYRYSLEDRMRFMEMQQL